jgi:hypothetical protein
MKVLESDVGQQAEEFAHVILNEALSNLKKELTPTDLISDIEAFQLLRVAVTAEQFIQHEDKERFELMEKAVKELNSIMGEARKNVKEQKKNNDMLSQTSETSCCSEKCST